MKANPFSEGFAFFDSKFQKIPRISDFEAVRLNYAKIFLTRIIANYTNYTNLVVVIISVIRTIR